MTTTTIRASLEGNDFIMVANIGVDHFIIKAMIEMIKADLFIPSIKLARDSTGGRLSLKESKDLADAIRDSINGRIQQYKIADDLNLLNL